MPGKLEIAKGTISFVAGAGVSKVVKDIIQNNTTVETRVDQALVWVGGSVIGSMIIGAGKKHVSAGIDDIVQKWQERKEEKPDEKSAPQ